MSLILKVLFCFSELSFSNSAFWFFYFMLLVFFKYLMIFGETFISLSEGLDLLVQRIRMDFLCSSYGALLFLKCVQFVSRFSSVRQRIELSLYAVEFVIANSQSEAADKEKFMYFFIQLVFQKMNISAICQALVYVLEMQRWTGGL